MHTHIDILIYRRPLHSYKHSKGRLKIHTHKTSNNRKTLAIYTQTSLASFSASRQSTKVQKYKKCKDVKNVKSTKNTKVKNKIKTPAISIKKHYK